MLDLLLQTFKDPFELDGLLGGYLAHGGKGKEKGTAHSGFAFHPNDTTVVLDDLPADRESKTGALGLVGKGVARLSEALEDLVLVFFGNADAGILYFHDDLPIVYIGFHRHLALVGKLYRVRQKVDDHLDQLVFVGLYQRAGLWVYFSSRRCPCPQKGCGYWQWRG